MADLQVARLIPASGIDTTTEAETRATSALLAVMSIVRPFSRALLDDLGASKADRATVESFIEVTYDHNGTKIRPDGLIRVGYGKKQSWGALVEVKTGDNSLQADQVNAYWDLARAEKLDAVITISNEIASAPGVHPTQGLKVRANSPIQVHHFSWTKILTEAVRVKVHQGVDDTEQAWVLGELIRYLEHPNSGALDFDDMGPDWVAVRDQAREGSLSKRSDGVGDIAQRWDQLVRFASLRLGADIGQDVQQVLSRQHRGNPTERSAYLVDHLAAEGMLEGTLRVPATAGEIDVVADLRAQQLTASMRIDAPQDKKARGRIGWLTRQLRNSPPDLVIEAWAKNARTATMRSTLAEADEDPIALLGKQRKPAAHFRLVYRADMGKARRTGRKSQGFVDSVLQLVERFYEQVVQDITPYQPKAPQIRREPTSEPAKPAVPPATTPAPSGSASPPTPRSTS